MSLKSKHIVVIGGSSGMGLATAKMLAKLGANVTIASRSVDKLEKATSDIPHPVKALTVDITDEDSVKEFYINIDKIDHLVITAAAVRAGTIDELSVEQAKSTFENKFWGSYIATKYALPHLSENSSVIYFSGMTLRKPILKLSVVAAACGAIEGLTKTLARELAPIRFNAISPGKIKTPLLGDNPEAKFSDYINRLPAKKLGQPDDIAKTVLFLLETSYITGQVVNVDGGCDLV